MNIFFCDRDPAAAAIALPDKHIVKMPVETVQMLVSACLRYDLQPGVLTAAGTVHKGGYANHPCTRWAGDNFNNAYWLLEHGQALCAEYSLRYGKQHFAATQLAQLLPTLFALPAAPGMTPPALAMPDDLKTDSPVDSYRNCIRAKVAAKPDSFVWRKGRAAPAWL